MFEKGAIDYHSLWIYIHRTLISIVLDLFLRLDIGLKSPSSVDFILNYNYLFLYKIVSG